MKRGIKELMASGEYPMTKQGASDLLRDAFDWEFDAFCSMTVDLARNEHDSEMLAMAYVLVVEGSEVKPTMVVFTDMPQEYADREKAFTGLGARLAAEKSGAPSMFFFASEAWAAKAENGDRSKLPKYLKDAPNAQEILMMHGITCGKERSAMRTAPLSRQGGDGDGRGADEGHGRRGQQLGRGLLPRLHAGVGDATVHAHRKGRQRLTHFPMLPCQS